MLNYLSNSILFTLKMFALRVLCGLHVTCYVCHALLQKVFEAKLQLATYMRPSVFEDFVIKVLTICETDIANSERNFKKYAYNKAFEICGLNIT